MLLTESDFSKCRCYQSLMHHGNLLEQKILIWGNILKMYDVIDDDDDDDDNDKISSYWW